MRLQRHLFRGRRTRCRRDRRAHRCPDSRRNTFLHRLLRLSDCCLLFLCTIGPRYRRHNMSGRRISSVLMHIKQSGKIPNSFRRVSSGRLDRVAGAAGDAAEIALRRYHGRPPQPTGSGVFIFDIPLFVGHDSKNSSRRGRGDRIQKPATDLLLPRANGGTAVPPPNICSTSRCIRRAAPSHKESSIRRPQVGRAATTFHTHTKGEIDA